MHRTQDNGFRISAKRLDRCCRPHRSYQCIDNSSVENSLLSAHSFFARRRFRTLLSSQHVARQPLTRRREEPMMINWLKQPLYHPVVILPVLSFGQLVVEMDFNMGQVAVVLIAHGLLYAWHVGLTNLGLADGDD
jgi:hypothetical protein